MKKKTKRFLFLTTAALAGMYAYNRFVANTSTNKNMLPTAGQYMLHQAWLGKSYSISP